MTIYFTKIYLEGDVEAICEILTCAKHMLGKGINVIDLNPQLVDEAD